MATNPMFRLFTSDKEQDLIKSLTREVIRSYGQDMWYLPRNLINTDTVLGQASVVEFNEAYVLEMYIKNVSEFGGDGDFFSKFGVEVRDTINFEISTVAFEQEVGVKAGLRRPREGDLIFFPMAQRLYQINYVDNKPMFYPLGALPAYEVRCEMFEYSSERFNTGIPEIDRLQRRLSNDAYDYGITDEDGLFLTDEDGNLIVLEVYMSGRYDDGDNEELQTEGDEILDFSDTDPFSKDGAF